MGSIYYGQSSEPIYIEDRTLAHLKVVIATKLRRNESFTLSWRHEEGQERGRETLWLHPSIPLRFVFDEPEPPELSAEWLRTLAGSASSTGGIQLLPEHMNASNGAGAAGADARGSADGGLPSEG